ncbi:hypothetical protein [Escherichia coli]|uniref:hypothetical protein n=1 Tax=Escherichia coli TaxID=562 RepID=UPI0038B77D8D
MKTNHPANGPVSLDRLHQIREILSKAAAQSDGGNLGCAMDDAVKVIDGAIAARNVETIYQVMYGECWRDITEEQYHDHAIHESPIRIVYTAPPAQLVPEEVSWEDVPEEITEDNMEVALAWAHGFNHCRTAMLQVGNSPVTQDGYVLVPKKLTAENGAKGVLSGEFSETKFINCPECFGDDECETCDSSGRIEITVPVSWTNIKAIWAKGVEHFEAAPQQEVK